MPFLLRIDPRVAVVNRLIPPALRSIVGIALWGFAALTFFLAAAGAAAPLNVPAAFDAVEVLGFAFILSGFAWAWTLFAFFVSQGLEQPAVPGSLRKATLRARNGEPVNIAPYLSADVLRTLPVLRAPSLLRVTEGFFASPLARPMLARLLLNREDIAVALRATPADTDAGALARVFETAAIHAVRYGHERIRFSDALVGFTRASVAVRQVLFDHSLDISDLDIVAHWEDRRAHARERRRAFWTREALLSVRPFARSWSYGYTPTVDRFSVDLARRLTDEQGRARALGRTGEIRRIEEALVRSKSANALLVGDPGVGTEEILAGFTQRVARGATISVLGYRRVVAIDLGAAVGGLRSAGEVEGRVRQILAEAARAGGALLVLENIHQFLGAEAGGVPVDVTAALTPFLEGSRVQVVATTTHRGLHEVVEKREALANLFERIEVSEPDAQAAIQMLLEALPDFEKRFGVTVPYPAAKAVVTFADRTIQDVPFPRKAFDVLEDAMIAAAREGVSVLDVARIARTISERTAIPVGELGASEREKLLKLEAIIHERIVGQKRAVRALADALRRARAGVTAGASMRPIGTFLFLGPTGVGKTETAKALAESYFGSEERMVRLDLSEFQGVDAIDRLIGSPATREEGRLTTAVRETPFTLILLDEFEKAHPKVLDLFLPVFDEGRMKDGWGREVVFTNALLIATSNAGAEFIREYLKSGQDPEQLRETLREEILQKGLFRPELLNRFDGVVVFQPLGPDEVREIAKRLLARFSENLKREKGVLLTVADDALEQVIAQGFNQEFGARELRRVLQDTVENAVAKKLLERTFQRGETIAVTREDIA